MSKVILQGYIIVPEAELSAIQEELANHKKLTLEEPGCIVFQVVQSEGDPCRFDVYEEFSDKASFETHQDRVKASDWGKISANVERHYKILA